MTKEKFFDEELKTEEIKEVKPPKKNFRKKKVNFAGYELVEKLGVDIPDWELAALKQNQGWAEGKSLKKDDFEKALKNFRMRRQGD
ncbi:MAG: hypothetical protein GY760_21215 [Deltaproteobacteria bacterium]|nr:hypothetical protein [Deltaproteobacteria bacterium]